MKISKNKQARIEFEVLLFMIALVVVSALVLWAVQSGIVTVRADGAGEKPILNAEFIPYGREGYLAVKEFQFCSAVDKKYNCLEEKEEFKVGKEVHFRFVVESTTVYGKVALTENYRVKGPDDNVLLEVDDNSNFNFESEGGDKVQKVYFKDFIITEKGDARGKYTLELMMNNPLLEKKAVLVKEFEVVEFEILESEVVES